jgi:protein-glucosylgalactosylhydroxylysine glucosidase
MKHVILLFLFFLNVFPLHKVFANADNWCIEVSSKENYNGVTLANGRIGLVSGADLFAVSEIVLNGVFDKEYAGGVSRMVRAPNV